MRKIVVDMQNFLFADSIATAFRNSDYEIDVIRTESPTNSSISIAAITYKEIHYEDVKRQGLLDGTTWDEYKSQNSADTKMTVDQDMYSLVANATGINESNITIIAYESPIFYDKESSHSIRCLNFPES